MNLVIRGFREVGTLEKERIVLDAIADTDVGSFMLLATKYVSTGTVSTNVRRAYWFPDKAVKKGDVIVVYTKAGKTNEKVNDDQTTSHFFYWGLSQSVWNVQDAAGVILAIDDWKAAKAT